MSDHFAVSLPGPPQVVRGGADDKKLVVATGKAFIAPLIGEEEGGGGNPLVAEGSWEPFTRKVIERDSLVMGNATIHVIPEEEA